MANTRGPQGPAEEAPEHAEAPAAPEPGSNSRSAEKRAAGTARAFPARPMASVPRET